VRYLQKNRTKYVPVPCPSGDFFGILEASTHVFQHHVVALSREEGRKIFFNEKNFNMEEGYRILGGPIPNPRDINIKTVEGGAAPFVKHVLSLFRKDRMMDGAFPPPALLSL
jgi:hypothetical protein